MGDGTTTQRPRPDVVVEHGPFGGPDRPRFTNIRWFDEISIDDVGAVGGKNASLGEMYVQLSQTGVRVPFGFATTADAFRRFLAANGLDHRIAAELEPWDGSDVDDLAVRARRVRELILGAELGAELTDEIVNAYHLLSTGAGVDQVEVAVRSSATAEDLPEASFAGQQESFLMVVGAAKVLDTVRACFASLYNARAISYRRHLGIDETDIALSAGVQRMVRADQASSGVIFTLDPDSGHRGVVSITATWGLGENIVQGRVVPDSFTVHKERLEAGFAPLVGKTVGAKELRMTYDEHSGRIRNERTAEADREQFCVTDDDVLQLARWAISIEDHYSAGRGVETPMDIEWAKDGRTGELFIVQARPETVHSQRDSSAVMEVHRLLESGRVLGTGLAVGDRIASGRTRSVIDPSDMGSIQPGDVLVAETTDPDWEPIMKRASALVTERGGRTSHAAIVARELGIPAIVGMADARSLLGSGTEVTVSCAEGSEGRVYEGLLRHEIDRIDVGHLSTTSTDIMVNLGDPGLAYKTALLPAAGIGLARMEFIFASHVGIHPLALLRPELVEIGIRAEIRRRTAAYDRPADFLVDRVALGVGTLAAAFWPRPVILRFSDFKTNEYAGLLGGEVFEPIEENPMIGWRGASRYYHPDYRAGFELELAAIRRVRSTFGLTNLKVMVPFCRTPDEGRQVIAVMAENGLVQGEDGLEVYVMTEIPANVLQADEFAEVFDGFSIGSNDLTQLTLGVDRDSDIVSALFDERNPAVMRSCAMAIGAARHAGRKIGICGQAPSDFPDFTAFLVEQGIDSISVTPDALVGTIGVVAEAEATSGEVNDE
ncbi:MAG: phosphoenolpyruvate synthase [Acidimicrobiia bacterium]|nr:phosphoenolpyruvate synthase [Acidimicrobiia bacterium]